MYCLLAGAELLYLLVAFRSWNNGWTDVCLFTGLFAAQFGILAFAAFRYRGRISARLLLAVAILFRVTLLPAGFENGEWQRFQLYDSDIWRYLWDGHVLASGVNPYRYAPRDAALDFLSTGEWTDVRDNVNYGDIPTIYPPAAQAVFFLTHSFGVLGMKLAASAFDLTALVLLMLTLRARGRPVSDAVWYGWNPLVIKVFAGSGHIDSLLVAGLAGMFYAIALKSKGRSTAAYAFAVLCKWSPLALLPLLLRERAVRPLWLGLLLLPAVLIPHAFAGAAAFATFWEFNALPHALLRELLGSALLAKVACGLLVLAVACGARKNAGDFEDFVRHTGYALGSLVILAPAVMPWYATWLLPGAVLTRDFRWIAFSGAVFAAFFVMVDGQERWWITAAEYGILLMFWWRGERNATTTVTGFRARALGAR
jgi:alpha-1,6-mannosyltransferase